ncbi:hypothetical protein [Deinococcus cellulosilyticus]|uniref:Uncharacterized protein n=1 Tax=Deinococcus cellulosilyticus (strain DSM 18568 / NBRC 106333 / KACC 11606 / 5516J-15) TaxID=1223518 RepID=A0A511N283_DEIC1|nr:hypothetical protein [Deinococcus cellulosilyticus]GEM46959.1 hypothetical protein DC3_25940 [Deinococcus cellulosilyticus NBRC 106333 = KACC 11606]
MVEQLGLTQVSLYGIIALLILAVWYGVQIWQVNARLDHERQTAEELGKALNRYSRFEGQGLSSAEAMEVAKDSALIHKLAKMAERQRSLPTAEIDTMLTPIAEEVQSWLTPLRSAPNLLMLGGLVITLIGLGQTIGNLPVREANVEQLTAALPEALSEMKGAFYGSMFGVGCALLLGFMFSYTLRKSQQLLTVLSNVGHSYLAPLILLPRIEKQVEILQNAITETRDFFKELSQQMQKVTQDFGKEIGAAGKVMKDSLIELKSSAKDVHDQLKQVSENVITAANELAKGTQEFRGLHTELQNAHTSLENMFVRSQSELDRRASEHLQQLQDMQTNFGKSSQNILSHLLVTSEGMGQLTQNMDATRKELETSSERIAQKVQGSFEGLHGMLDTTLTAHQREMGQVGQHLQAMTTRIETLSDRSMDVLQLSEHIQEQEKLRHLELLKTLASNNQGLALQLQQTMEAHSPLEFLKDQKVYQTAALGGLIQQQERMMETVQQASAGLGTQLHLDLQKTQDLLNALQTVIPERQHVHQWIFESGDQLQDRLEHYVLTLQGQLRKTHMEVQDLKAALSLALQKGSNGHSNNPPPQSAPPVPPAVTVKLEQEPGEGA